VSLSGRLTPPHWRLIAVAAAALAALAVAALFVLPLFGAGGPSGPRAVIVDQLDSTAPDQPFVDDATSMLEAAGYAVDYLPGEKVNVDFYRRLPSHNYEIILLRTHAGLRRDKDGKLTGDAHLFTSEPYSKKKYVDEQVATRLKAAGYNKESIARGELFFAIPELFVTDSMKGNFGGAAVVLMGCDVFRSEKLAEAFVQKGAGAVVGWNDLVTSAHTDDATLAWLDHYLNDHMSAQAAAAAAASDVGPDPSSGAELLSYPSSG
jgi:hypothetical protein